MVRIALYLYGISVAKHFNACKVILVRLTSLAQLSFILLDIEQIFSYA